MRIIYLTLLLLLTSCLNSFKKEEVLGIYSPVDYKNCFDTIQIIENGTYFRKVYDIQKKIVLDMKGEWRFYDENKRQFVFSSYYFNFDDDLIKFPESIKNRGSYVVNIERNNGRIEFCVGIYSADLPNQQCYQKQVSTSKMK